MTTTLKSSFLQSLAETNFVINEYGFIDIWSRASKLPNEVIYKGIQLIL